MKKNPLTYHLHMLNRSYYRQYARWPRRIQMHPVLIRSLMAEPEFPKIHCLQYPPWKGLFIFNDIEVVANSSFSEFHIEVDDPQSIGDRKVASKFIDWSPCYRAVERVIARHEEELHEHVRLRYWEKKRDELIDKILLDNEICLQVQHPKARPDPLFKVKSI